MPHAITLSGLYPRRESLVKATWNFDKGLATAQDLAAERRAAVQEVVDLQARVGVDGFVDGNLSWQDAFRGLIEGNAAFEVGGVTRIFEMNRFYRQPIVRGTPTVDPTTLAPHFLLDGVKGVRTKKANLPSPYHFARVAKNETKKSDAAVAKDVATYLNGVARWLEGRGYGILQFNEPLLFYEAKPDLRLAEQLLEATLKGLKAQTVVNFPLGDATRHLAWAAKLPASAIGIDFVETHAAALKSLPPGRNLVAAVVDSQESLQETADDVSELVTAIEARLRPARLTLTNTADLETLPTPVASRKVETLAQVARGKVVA